MKQAGDICSCCADLVERGVLKRPCRLVQINGALVCPKCDCVNLWPGQGGTK